MMAERTMGCWLFRGKTLIFKESVERPALFLFSKVSNSRRLVPDITAVRYNL